MPLIWYVYLGRAFSLVVWVALTAAAIKFMPAGKWFLVAIALLPTSLTQAATISADGLVNGLSWLIIALTLAILAKKLKTSWGVLIALTGLIIYLSIIKESYWLIALFPLVVPLSFFQTKLQGILWKVSSTVSVLGAVTWFTLVSTKKVSNVVLTPTIGINVNTKQQLHYLLHHKVAFTIRALWQPYTKSFDSILLGIRYTY